MADLDALAASLGGLAAPTTDPGTAAPVTPPSQDLDALAAQHGGLAVPTEPGQPSAPSTPSWGGHEPDLAGAALTGLKSTLAPHLLTKEELETPKTGAETAVEVGTNLASDVALGAGIGMFIGPEGALLGAGAGALVHVALAAYRGFGYEYAKSRASGQEFDPVKGLLNTAAQINPLVGVGNKITKAASQAALEFASRYQYSQDTTDASVAGGVGAIIAGLTHHNTGQWLAFLGAEASRPTSATQRAPFNEHQMTGSLILASDDSKYQLGAKCEAALKTALEQDPNYLSPKNLYASHEIGSAGHEDVLAFESWLTDQPGISGDDARTAMQQFHRMYGQQGIEQAYGVYKKSIVANGVVDQLRKDLAADIAGAKGHVGDPVDPVGGLTDYLRDIKFVMRKIDGDLGSNFEGAVMNFSRAKQKASNLGVTHIATMNGLVTQARRQGMDLQDVGRWLAEPDLNKARKASNAMARMSDDSYPVGFKPQEQSAMQWNDKQQKIADGFRQWFEDVRTTLSNEGLNIDFLNGGTFSKGDRYLPMKELSGHEAAKAFRMEGQRLQQEHGADYLTRPESYDLRRAAGRALGLDPGDINYRSQIESATNAAMDGTTKNSAGYNGGMAFRREIGLPVPEFIRDYDVGSLGMSYLNNGLKAAIYRDPMMQLNAQLETLRGMGFDGSADYLSKYVSQISGQQGQMASGLAALTTKHKDMLERMIENVNQDSAGAGVKTGALKAAQMLPDFAGFALSSIYPNMLGWNFRAALRDFTKPFLLTAPELGWDYGMKTVGRSIVSAAWDLMKGAKLSEELSSRNLLPARHMGAGGDVTATGLRSVKGVGALVEGVDKLDELSMLMYSQTDKMNRYIQLKVGHQLAADLQAGDERATKYVTKMLSEGNKAELRAAGVTTYDDVKTMDTKKLGDILGSQLVSKTSFDYGKEGMNAFGRDMGRMFSMFTKWPAMMMSDAAEQWHRGGTTTTAKMTKGSAAVTARYLAPMAAMVMASEYLLDTENNPYQRFMIGKNLAEWAPAQSWKIGTPPVLQTAQDFGATFLHMFDADKDREQKLGELGKFAQRNVLQYVPGMAPFNEYRRWDRANNPEEYK